MNEDIDRKQRRRLYNIWSGMVRRCEDPKRERYKNYGGRGIKVCDTWRNDFESFVLWALSNGYSDNLTIDRIDVDGDYNPDNCRWSNMKEQANNKKNNVLIEINGQTKTVAQWSDHIGISRDVVYKWVGRYGEEYAIKQILNFVASGEYTKVTKKKLNCSMCGIEYEGGWGGNGRHLCPNCRKIENRRRSREHMKKKYHQKNDIQNN